MQNAELSPQRVSIKPPCFFTQIKMLLWHKFIRSYQGVLRNPWKRKQEIGRKQKIRLVVHHTYHRRCFYAYHRFLSLFGSGKPVSSSSPHLLGHPQRNHGCHCLLNHWNRLLRNCSCCRERIMKIKTSTARSFWMNAIWDSLSYSWHLTLKVMASVIFSLHLCMSVSHQSSISPHYFYKRKDGEEGKRGRYNSSTSSS